MKSALQQLLDILQCLPNNRMFIFSTTVGLFVSVISCDEFLEEDITDKMVSLRSPSPFAELDSTAVGFWWDGVDGATEFQFQLVSPSFDSAQLFITDSLLVENRLFLNLGQGSYEWAVRAFNGAYTTPFSSSSFSIDTAQIVIVEEVVDISDLVVALNAPVDHASIESGSTFFWWDKVPDATSYHLQIVQPSFELPELLIYDTLIEENTLSLAISDLGLYEWRVRALNSTSATLYESKGFQIDPRKEIQLLSPSDGYITNEINLPLQWQFDGVVDLYVIRLLGNEEFGFTSEEAISVISLDSASGSYQWFVSGVDVANGSSVTSDTLSFEYVAGPPGAPINRVPADNFEVVDNQVILQWERTLDNILRDSIYVFDTANQIIDGFPVGTLDTQYTLLDLDSALYRWTVISLDNQGLQSLDSDTLSFIVR